MVDDSAASDTSDFRECLLAEWLPDMGRKEHKRSEFISGEIFAWMEIVLR